MKELIKGKDYYFDPQGFFVFTSAYHLGRGYCCGFECRECPFDYQAVPEPRRNLVLAAREEEKKSGARKSDLG